MTNSGNYLREFGISPDGETASLIRSYYLCNLPANRSFVASILKGLGVYIDDSVVTFIDGLNERDGESQEDHGNPYTDIPLSRVA